MADIHEASLIAIEGTEGCDERKSHLNKIFIEDQLQMHDMLQDTIQFLADDIAERRESLDSQYEWSRGILPPNTADEDSTPPSRMETDDEMDEDDMVNCLEDRFATRLLTTPTSQELADNATLTPADTSAPTPVIPNQPVESAITTPVTQDPPPPSRMAHKACHHKHQRPATSTSTSIELTHS